MKKLYFSAVFLAAFLFMVSVASAALQIDNVTSPSGNPGGPVTVQFTVSNTGSSAIATVVVDSDVLVGPGGTIPKPSVSNILNLGAGSDVTRTFTVNLPLIQSGVYSSTLTVKDGSDASNTDSKPYSVNINSVFGLDVTDRDTSTNRLIVNGDQGDRLTSTFKVKNTGSEPITDLSLNFNQADFEDADDDQITLSHNMPSTLQPGAEVTVTLTLNIDSAIEMNTYDGTVTVNGGGKSDTFTLEVRVQPEVCERGNRGNLRLDLREPDSGDDFKPGDKITIEAKVENNANEDLDIAVTAFLFDVDDGDKVEEVDSDTIDIDEDDDDTFEFDLVIPDDVDESHEFKLFVKAYEDGNEDEQCEETSVKLDIKREKYDVVVKSIRVSPLTAKVGDSVSIEVTVQNIGSRDQDDVYISVKEPEIGLDLRSNTFSLEKFDDDDTQIERFTFKIPDDVDSGSYDVEAIVTFDSRTSSNFASLRVEAPPEPPEPFATLEVTNVPTSVDAGKPFDLSVKVTNTGDATETFSVEISNLASWAEILQPQTVTLGAGRTGTLFFTIRTKEDVTGSQSASVSVLSGSEVLDSQSITVNLKAPEEDTGPSFDFGGIFSGTTLWIIADILLVVIAIIFIRMLFKSRKREQ